jgi:predicted Zn finger-like uncharacterized protein
MKLTCPNCGAQYEVPDDVIPETGRDVQCSNCGDTWFQAHRDHPLPEDMADTDDWEEGGPDSETPDTDTPENETADSDAPVAKHPDHHAPEQQPPANSAKPSDPTPPQPDEPERRAIDPAIASVLREEAERETRARAAARGGLETQPDLGLRDDPDDSRRAREARTRMARMRGEESEDNTAPQDIDPTSRRGLFPDIEEINSSLAPGGDTGPDGSGYDTYPEAVPGRGGFRRGFFVALLIVVAALLIYMFAPQLGDMFPAFHDLLTDYVVWVDSLRQWLDGQIAALMLSLDGMASGASVPADGAAGN